MWIELFNHTTNKDNRELSVRDITLCKDSLPEFLLSHANINIGFVGSLQLQGLKSTP